MRELIDARRALRPGRRRRRLAPHARGWSLRRPRRARRRRRHRRRDRAGAGRRGAGIGRRHPRALARHRPPASRTAASSGVARDSTRRCPPTVRRPAHRRSRPAAPGSASRSPPTRALSTGDGIAMAMRAGVAVADLEFMQFHPTALHHPSMPRPLLSEALRGEGAILRDEHGVAFMADEHPLADLAPRDVVAKAISRRLIERDLDHLWLDATAIDDFPHRFPTIWSACQRRRARPDPRLAAGGARRALPLRRRLHRPRRRLDAPGALGMRRGRVHRRARRQPPGVELVARRAGVRGARSRGHPRRAATAPSAPVCSAASSSASRVLGPSPVHLDPGPSIREELQRVMTRDAGVVRSADEPRRAPRHALATMTRHRRRGARTSSP